MPTSNLGDPSAHLDTGGLVDAGASSIAENLSQWRPRKGDGGWPPSPSIFGTIASRLTALLRATFEMHRRGLTTETAKVLEVGCGYGDGLRPMLTAGFRAHNMTGLDLMPERLEIAKGYLPGMTFIHGNAAKMDFADGTFDVVCEQYCFCHIPSDAVKEDIAREMLRVVRPGGFIVIHDWSLTVRSRNIYGPSMGFIQKMFSVGERTKLVSRIPSQIWPQIGNAVSRYALPIYPLLCSLPGFAGSRIVVLQRQSN